MELSLSSNYQIATAAMFPVQKDVRVTSTSSLEHTVVIFDWDNTLFCTDYLEMLKPNYESIFSGESSLEDLGCYLSEEMLTLENVY
jgi:hypothetical protein